jgi:regulator of sirC expression with transglutaminase-like and TPR domain
MTPEEARERLQQVASGPEPWPLAEAALLLAVDEYPGMDPAPYLEQLTGLATRVGARVRATRSLAEGGDAAVALDALLHVLLAEEGYAGNPEEYYDPRNSCLNEVIDRRRGIPITLSVVAIAVARRAGLPLAGVGFPAHFLVRWGEGEEKIFIDLFHGGARPSREELQVWWARATGGSAWDEKALQPASDRQILLRVLNNLKMIYARTRQFDRTLRVIEKMLLLDPFTPDHYRALGYLHGGAKSLGKAIEYLERYLALAPDAPDAGEVRQQLRAITNTIARWN